MLTSLSMIGVAGDLAYVESGDKKFNSFDALPLRGDTDRPFRRPALSWEVILP